MSRTYPLPLISGSKQQIHLKPNAILQAYHTLILIPKHWKQQIKGQLDQDEQIEVIHKAPLDVAAEWCMRMITVPKRDGTPQTTIDFQPNSKLCQLETHHTPNLYEVVSNIKGFLATKTLQKHMLFKGASYFECPNLSSLEGKIQSCAHLLNFLALFLLCCMHALIF